MPQVKLTTVRGKPDLKNVTVSAGTPEAQTDTISLNIDITRITKGDATIMVEALREKILASTWPLI